MKKSGLVTFLLFFVFFINAQTSGGPDAFGYTWKSSHHTINPPPVGWFDITNIGTLVTGLADDNVVGPFNINNGFRYYWYNPPKFWIGSNGYITFDGDNIASPFPAGIPLASGANNYIAGLLSDLNFSGTSNPGKCYYYSNADTLCVSYNEVPYWNLASPGYTGQNSFQIILSRIDSSITFNYIFLSLGLQTTIDNVVGIENVTGTIGLSSFVDSIPPDTFSLKYYYPVSTTFQIVDGGMNWNDNDLNGGIFLKKGGKPYPMIANTKNFGNTALTSYTVLDTVYNSSGNPVSNGSAGVGSLAVGIDTTVNFSDSFVPPAAGTYVNRTLSVISGDLVSSNNGLDQEMIAVDTSGIMTLDYSDGVANGGGLGWNGGNGGIAIYIKPPIYPAKIKSSRFFITANATPAVGFHAVIYDDDGPNGSHGTVLDSVFVAGNTITNNVYKVVGHGLANVVIDSGGFYLLWYMDGAGINLGRDISQPISRRTIEVISGGWGGYRDLLTEDFLMGVNVDYAWPRADFNALLGFDPQIEFVDMSSNDPITWYWTFGDNDTSTAQNPTHTYLENGKYEVCLAVSNSYGSDTICDTVEVSSVVPTAFFTYNDSAFPQIAFKDESIGPPTSWEWNLADTAGPVVVIQDVVYTFKNNGIRNVCLIATNVNGSSAPYCEAIEIFGIGMAELLLKELTIQPNPINDKAVILLPPDINSENLSLLIVNILGAEVEMDVQIEQTRILISREGLKDGTYIIQLMDGGKPVAFAQVVVE